MNEADKVWNEAIKAAENVAMEYLACPKSGQPTPDGEAIWKKIRMLRRPPPRDFAASATKSESQ